MTRRGFPTLTRPICTSSESITSARRSCGCLVRMGPEMVSMEEEDASDGRRDRGLPTYLQLASVLQEKVRDARAGVGDGGSLALRQILEFAAQEFGIGREDYGEGMVRVYTCRKKAKRETAIDSNWVVQVKEQLSCFTCEHSCCDHKEVMSPRLWGSLPQELLQLVFVHLPVDGISRLQFLNKEWKQTLAAADCQFFRECDQVQRKVLCLITRDSMTKKFWVRVFNTKCEWHTYQIDAGYPDYLHWTPECEDGGLVCFVAQVNDGSSDRDTSPTVFLNVVNPLKRVLLELPPLCKMRGSIFQMKVDRRTKEFKVFVVAKRLRWTDLARYGSMWMDGGVTVQIFDSLTKEWTTVEETRDLVFGFRHKHTWAYDCADGGRFLNLPDSDTSPLREDFLSSARHKDHIFVLRMGTDGPAKGEPCASNSATYYIEEFQCQMRGKSWLKTDIHRCNPFERPPKRRLQYFMRLYACNGLLMVLAELAPFHVQGRFENKLGWLYDLSRRKWSVVNLPQLPVGKKPYSGDPDDPTYSVDLICEPQWAV